jgi:hypothetical protein
MRQLIFLSQHFLLVCCFETVSHSMTQADLKLAIPLPQPPRGAFVKGISESSKCYLSKECQDVIHTTLMVERSYVDLTCIQFFYPQQKH